VCVGSVDASGLAEYNARTAAISLLRHRTQHALVSD
jgi:hypothetical protein